MAERNRRCSPCSRRPRSKRIAGSRLLLDPFRAALRAHLKGCLTRSLIYATKSLAAPLRRGLDLLPVRGEKTNRPKLRSVRPAPPPLPPYFVLHSAPVFPSNEQFLVQQRLGDRLIRTGLWRVQTVLLPGCERRDQSSDCQDVSRTSSSLRPSKVGTDSSALFDFCETLNHDFLSVAPPPTHSVSMCHLTLWLSDQRHAQLVLQAAPGSSSGVSTLDGRLSL